MIKGMTGFGSAVISAGKVKGIIEIKTQNHRYFDIVYYLPPGFSSLESEIRLAINKLIERGRITVALKITERPLHHLTFNKEAVQEYLKYARVLKKEYGLHDALSLSDLIRLPGVVETKDVVLSVEALWPEIEKSLLRAMKSLMSMRAREGRALTQDMSNVLKRMIVQVKKIRDRAAVILKEKKEGLPSDEFLSFQKGVDISEELTRLMHYIEEFKLLLKSETGVGKKLDFVAQEMQRETNTIGSKVQDREISNAVIAIKGKIEKLREQSQNVE